MSINLDKNHAILRSKIEHLTENERPPNRGTSLFINQKDEFTILKSKKVSSFLDTIPEGKTLDYVIDRISKYSIPVLSYSPSSSPHKTLYTPTPPNSPKMPTYPPPILKRSKSCPDIVAIALSAYTEKEIDEWDIKNKLEKEESLITFEEEGQSPPPKGRGLNREDQG